MSDSGDKTFCTVSAVPPTLHRAFKHLEYAQQFIEGDIRAGELKYYREAELSRRDETEGKGFIRWNTSGPDLSVNEVSYTLTSTIRRYILCTSRSPVCECHIEAFGHFVVLIQNPLRLLERVCAAWDADPRAASSA